MTPLGGGRKQQDGAVYIDVSGNDYLGLSRHPHVIEYASNSLHEYGAGSTASRLITGTTDLHAALETELATWLHRESALVFNSGYQMNTSLIAALADRNTHLFFDKSNHNSLVQGAVLSRAHLHRYRHADLRHLETLLDRHAGDGKRCIIVTESIFSMDGDAADVSSLASLSSKYNALLIVDEAHAIGLAGSKGRGLSFGIDGVDIVLGTFGKSFGSFGAFAACSSSLRDYLINFCGGFIYTTALPPAVVAATLASLRLMPELDSIRAEVLDKAALFRRNLAKSGFSISGSVSQIVPVIIGGETATITVANELRQEGFWATAIRPPTVEPGTSRLRFTITAALQRDDLHRLVQCLITSCNR